MTNENCSFENGLWHMVDTTGGTTKWNALHRYIPNDILSTAVSPYNVLSNLS